MLEGVRDTKQSHPFLSVMVSMGKPRRVSQTSVMALMDLEKQEPEDWYETLPELKTREMKSVLLWAALVSLSWAPRLQEAGGFRDPGPRTREKGRNPLLEVSNHR